MAVMLPDKWSQLKLPSIGKADAAEQERLLKLFWNRAELKKELQSLDDQLHNLRNKLKQQENANSRLQQQLEQLEVLLGNSERGVDALVHFGLKALWRACREQLEKFAAELKRERQDAQRKQQLAEFQQDRAERLKVADERLRQAQEVGDAERGRMAQLEARMAQLKRFWHHFKRRALAAEILAQRERCAGAERHLADMQESHRTIEKEPWPEFPGLTIEGRRLVNLAVIAYAQHLFARLAVSGAGVLVVLLLLPGGLGAACFRVRDLALRSLARRRGVVVPSLLADVATDASPDAAVPHVVAEPVEEVPVAVRSEA